MEEDFVMIPGSGTKKIIRDVKKEIETAFLDYSMSVIVSRALPDVRDGLKPVHRRILFAQQELANSYNRPPKKCARIVGDVSRAVPQAAGILTSGEMGETARPEELAAFLSEELAIGDAEAAAAAEAEAENSASADAQETSASTAASPEEVASQLNQANITQGDGSTAGANAVDVDSIA